MCCTRLAENTGRKKLPFWHHRTTLSGCIFGTKACIDNRKKNLLNSNTSSACPDNMVNVGLLKAEIYWRVWGTRANFNGFHIFAALLHGTLVVGVSQTLRCWTQGATYIWQGGHQVGHWPTFLVFLTFSFFLFSTLVECSIIHIISLFVHFQLFQALPQNPTGASAFAPGPRWGTSITRPLLFPSGYAPDYF